MSRAWAIVLAGLVGVAASCADDGVAGGRSLFVPDFHGVVASAELAADYASGPASARHDGFRGARQRFVGPMTITLESGRRLDVPAGTPGGDGCAELLPDLPLDQFDEPCTVIGALDDDGRVEWFQILFASRDPGMVFGAGVVEGDSFLWFLNDRDVVELDLDASFEEPECNIAIEGSIDPTTLRVVRMECPDQA